ncbi:hypothetical protein AOL_s00140g89 [Orbilia oligospora ATCC 24927]|uniref:Uncharacterized protein n=1 Tax=Arthrobotrys oligospora (strain ATCC 24927 / CBS 115.81 / DSM 1491) TaxID=756982 RepID=G1XMC0_ARTOA|nr:hypothetical protein AOL_s00140g89 [Orbilia oligospora ATCC 24927]EGX45773.1 hypothetical protein AOL_s00140g89 [Orbilia oligospora ATCC 24927]
MDDAIAEMKRLAHARIPETREGQPIDPKVVPVVWNGVPIRLWPKDDQEKIRKLVPGAQDLGLEVRPYIHTKSIPRESRKPVPTRTSNNLPADWTSITSLYIQTKSIPRKSQKPEPPPTSTMTDTRTSVTWSNRLPLFRTATAEINQKDGPL